MLVALDARRTLVGSDFPVHLPAATRWSDNDMFGHLNNAVYYEIFDTAINGWLAAESGIDGLSTPELGVVAESGCVFYQEVAFPQQLTVGMRVARLGTSSVTYQLGVFAGAPPDVQGQQVAAVGRWVHVYIDRVTRRATAMPAPVRELLERLVTQ